MFSSLVVTYGNMLLMLKKIININETKQPMKTLYSHRQNGFHLTCRGMLLVCLYQNLSDPEI